jgi:hypothetical protein
MKLTPWFPGNVKPVRPGVYQQMCGFNRDVGYQYWDGKVWGLWSRTIEGARHDGWPASPQNDPWRGLAEEPK